MTPIRTTLQMAPLLGIALALLAVTAPAQGQSANPASSAAHATPVRAHAAKASPPVAQKLDLATPPLNRIYSQKELRYILAYDPDDASDTEVSVRGSKSAINVPVTPGNQLLAVPWALLHPAQAWRVFTPIEQP
jgi:hypothetical protein